MTTKQRIYAYMRREACEHVDLDTGELCCTELAEDAITFMPLDEADEDLAYEVAFEIAEHYERGM